MKTKNYSKEYLKSRMTLLSKNIKHCSNVIRKCEKVIKREKELLNNSGLDHDRLWLTRDELKEHISLKKKYEDELKETHRFYLSKFYPQYKRSTIICFL